MNNPLLYRREWLFCKGIFGLNLCLQSIKDFGLLVGLEVRKTLVMFGPAWDDEVPLTLYPSVVRIAREHCTETWFEWFGICLAVVRQPEDLTSKKG